MKRLHEQEAPRFGLGVEIRCRVYKPRRARESPLFRMVLPWTEWLPKDERLAVRITRGIRSAG